MSDEDPKGYVVRDRRHFDASGEPRTDGEPPRARPAASPPRAPQGPGQGQAQAGGTRPAGGPASAGQQPRPRRHSQERVDFASLILSVATNAMASLQGGSADERIPGRPNLAAASQHIDILTMLEEKTRGNLTPEEEELLRGVLYDLQMQYVAAAGT